MKTIKVVGGQTVMDIAVQEYGNLEAVFEILENNQHMLNDYPDDEFIADRSEFDVGYSIKKGTELLIDNESPLVNKRVLAELKGKLIISE